MKKKNINRYQLGKRVVSCALALGLTAGSVSFQGNILGQNVKAAQVTNVKDGWYYIKNVNAQKYLQVTNNQSRNGANVELSKGTGVQGQKWYVKHTNDGYVTLTSAVGNFMLDIAGGANYDGANAQIYSAYSGNPQKFSLQPTSKNGSFVIATKCSNNSKCLDDYNFSKQDGANVCQWSRSGRENQQWIFEEVDQSGSTQPSNPQPSNPQPSNPQPSKQIEVNCPASAMATRQGVAYGRYTHETYYSKTCRMQRGYTVLLPENYNKNKKYPVLYLLHGVFGDENTFSSDPSSKVREIFYNLARDGKARQWIVVMPNMFAATNPAQRPALTPEGLKPYDNFKNDLVNDLMPCIESRYSVLKGRDNTAIAGFSLGGRETLYTSISYPNLFSYAAAFSPAPGLVPARDWATNHPGSLRPEQVVYPKAGQPNAMKTVMVMCGTADSVVGQFPKSYHELLAKNGVSHIWYEVPGANHDNNAVHSGLYNFLVQVG